MSYKLKINFILSSILTLLPIFAGVILQDRFPDSIPIHWNAAGEVDGYCGKAFAAFGLPALFFLFHVLICGITLAVSAKSNGKDKRGIIPVMWIMPIMAVFISAFVYATALGYNADSNQFFSLMFCVVFIVTGFILWKYPTLEVLNFPTKCIATRQFTGVLTMILSVIGAVMCLLGLHFVVIIMAAILIIAPIIYHFVRGRYIG